MFQIILGDYGTLIDEVGNFLFDKREVVNLCITDIDCGFHGLNISLNKFEGSIMIYINGVFSGCITKYEKYRITKILDTICTIRTYINNVK